MRFYTVKYLFKKGAANHHEVARRTKPDKPCNKGCYDNAGEGKSRFFCTFRSGHERGLSLQ